MGRFDGGRWNGGRFHSGRFAGVSEAADITAPEVTSSSYTDATQTVALTIVEASGTSTVYWALVANPSTPTEAQVVAGSGGDILEAGSFTATSGGDTDVISVTNETGDEIHLVVKDASDNSTGTPSALNNTIITGITVDSTAPTIISYSPADNATDVAVDADLVIVFSESMATGAATTVTLKNVGGATIETFDSSSDGVWSTTTNANDTWTVTPASSFTNEATLAVQYSGFKDVYGNTITAVANDTAWNWTVVAAVSAVFYDDFSSDTSGSYSSYNSSTIAYDGGDTDLDVTQTGAWGGVKTAAITVTPSQQLSLTSNILVALGSATSVTFLIGTSSGGSEVYNSDGQAGGNLGSGEGTLTGTFTPGSSPIYLTIFGRGGGDAVMNIHDIEIVES